VTSAGSSGAESAPAAGAPSGDLQLYAEFRRIADEQASLRRVATLVARGVEPSEVFDAVADELRRWMDAIVCGLWRYEPTGEVTLLASAATDPVYQQRWPVGTRTSIEGNTLASTVLRTGRPARMDDYEGATGAVAERVRHVGVHAAVGVPIIVDGRLWGMTAIGAVRPGPMPADSESRLSDFAELVATAIANAEARRELQASRDSLHELAEHQTALRRVAELVAREASPADVFTAVAEEMARCLGVDNASICRYEADAAVVVALSGVDPRAPYRTYVGERFPLDGDHVGAIVSRTSRPARLDSHEHASGVAAARIRELGVRCAVGVPIVVAGHLWGMAAVTSRAEPLPPDVETRMADFADLVATAIANAATRAELTASRKRIVTAGDEARRRLERDLHDGAQQRLVSLGVALREAECSIPPEHTDLKEQLSRIGSGLADVSEELREIARGIHPAILSRGGLGPALKALARRSSLPVNLEVTVERQLPATIGVAAYYVVAEALTNVAKHAHATELTISAHTQDGDLRLAIQDNGIGGADPAKGSGLIGLTDRVEALGGHVQISSPPRSGTSLDITLPLGGL
jgi:signal transduction histidine kinase